MDEQFNQQLDIAKMKGYMMGNTVQINQNIISSAKAHLFLSELTNTNKGQDNVSEANNTK